MNHKERLQESGKNIINEYLTLTKYVFDYVKELQINEEERFDILNLISIAEERMEKYQHVQKQITNLSDELNIKESPTLN